MIQYLTHCDKNGKMEKRPTPPGVIDDSEELQAISVREPPVRGTASLFQSERLLLRSMLLPSSQGHQHENYKVQAYTIMFNRNNQH